MLPANIIIVSIFRFRPLIGMNIPMRDKEVHGEDGSVNSVSLGKR